MTRMRIIKLYVRPDWLKQHNLNISDLGAELYEYLIRKYSDPGDI